MKIGDLHKYRENLEKLECVDRQLADKYVIGVTDGSRDGPSFAKTSRNYEGYIHGMGTVSLLAAKSQLEHENEMIKQCINAIPKKRIYKALKYYCLDDKLNNPKWNDIAEIMGERDAIALRKAVERYLEEITFSSKMSNDV